MVIELLGIGRTKFSGGGYLEAAVLADWKYEFTQNFLEKDIMLKKALGSLVFCLVVAAPFAKADTIFSLTQDGCTGGCGAGPFGTVTLSQTTSSTVTVTVALAAGEFFAGTGAGDALEFNVAGPITIGNITSGFAVGPAPDTASIFGTFLASVTCTACQGGKASNPAGPLSFTVTSATGVTIADFTGNGANGGGYFFASDIMGVTGNTGNVAAPGTPTNNPVPEPSSLLLLGTGLAGAAGLVRRKVLATAGR